jgi:hypothetical protein
MWLLQYNPAHEQPGTRWPVRRYRDRIAAGDEVALWASGPEGGVTGFGQVGPLGGSEVGPAKGMTIEIENVRTFPVVRRDLLREDPRFADALILRMPGGGNPFPLEPAQWQAIVERAPAELHLVGKTVLGAAALAAAGATALREAVRSVRRTG